MATLLNPSCPAASPAGLCPHWLPVAKLLAASSVTAAASHCWNFGDNKFCLPDLNLRILAAIT